VPTCSCVVVLNVVTCVRYNVFCFIAVVKTYLLHWLAYVKHVRLKLVLVLMHQTCVNCNHGQKEKNSGKNRSTVYKQFDMQPAIVTLSLSHRSTAVALNSPR